MRAAIVNSAYEFPSRRITVNLAPADLRKEGPSFDLPIALALLLATGQAATGDGSSRHRRRRRARPRRRRAAGRPARWRSPRALRRRGVAGAVVPRGQRGRGGAGDGLARLPGRATCARRPRSWRRAGEACRRAARAGRRPRLLGRRRRAATPTGPTSPASGTSSAPSRSPPPGRTTCCMSGPPGAGKTMLARRLPGIMPPLTLDEAIDVTRVLQRRGAAARRARHWCCGGRSARRTTPSPAPGLVGGGGDAASGRGEPRPSRRALPRRVPRVPPLGARRPAAAARGRGGDDLPGADVGALPGAHHAGRGDEPVPVRLPRRPRSASARVPRYRVRQYRARLSGPLLDRIDLRVEVPRLAPRERRTLDLDRRRRRCAPAWRRRASASSRASRGTGAYANAHMTVRHLRRLCPLDARRPVDLLDRAYERLHLSARACDRVVKVAQTIADLEGAPAIAVRARRREPVVPILGDGRVCRLTALRLRPSFGCASGDAIRRVVAELRARAIWLAELAAMAARVRRCAGGETRRRRRRRSFWSRPRSPPSRPRRRGRRPQDGDGEAESGAFAAVLARGPAREAAGDRASSPGSTTRIRRSSGSCPTRRRRSSSQGLPRAGLEARRPGTSSPWSASRSPSPYGREMAAAIARDLTRGGRAGGQRARPRHRRRGARSRL